MAWIEPSPKKNPGHRGPWNVRYREGGEKRWSGPFWNLPEARDEEAARTKQEREARKRSGGRGAGGTQLKQLWESYLTEAVNENVIRVSTKEQKQRMVWPHIEKYQTLRDLAGTWGGDDWGKEPQNIKTRLLTEPTLESAERAGRLQDENLLQPYSSSTASIILRALQTFLEWCKTKKYLPVNPMEEFKMPKSKRRRDMLRGGKKDVETVIESAPSPVFGLFLTFQIFQGQRKGMTRQAEGHEFRGGVWTIPGHKAKVDRDITLPLHPRVQAKLQEVFPKGLPAGPIFGERMAGAPDAANAYIWHRWQETLKKAALPYHVTIHGLRRTWATEFMKHTQNLAALMAAGAWKDAKTAMTYQHVQAKWLKDQVDGFDYEG